MLPVVWAVLRAGEAERVAPALAACVRLGGEVVHLSLHGTVREGVSDAPLRAGDPFDVASLTKVLCTTGVAASLAAEGRLALDAPVAEVLPEFAQGGKAGVTFRHLLAHAGGLTAGRPWFEAAAADPVAGQAFRAPAERPPAAALAEAFARGHALVTQAVLREPLEAAPGTRARYSDAGFIALGLALERLGGAPLPALAEARLLGPLGLRSTFFLDRRDPGAAAARAAGRVFVPTGVRPRRQEIGRGGVHDDNAWAMGGAAGHAGLFSTAEEVAAVGQAWLDAAAGRPSVVPAAAAPFARRDATPGSERALGWDTPGEGSSLGERLGRGPLGAIGHLGHTGCSLWIDLDAELVCALLTNHTHPGGAPDRPRIRAFRRRFHDAVAEAVGIGF